MAITKNLVINIQGDRSVLQAPLSVYYMDRGIDLFFKIKDIDYTFPGDMLTNLDNATVSIIIKKPNGEVYRTTKASVENSQVKFTITKEITDELSEIGKYTLQFQFYDNTNDGRISIPPIEFTVKELIAPLEDSPTTQGLVDSAYVNEAVVSSGQGVEVLAKWSPGELITANKLNAMVDGIKSVQHGAHSDIPKTPSEYEEYFDTTLGYRILYYNGKWHDEKGFIIEEVISPQNK